MCHVRFDTKLKIFLIRLINLSFITFRDNNIAVMIGGNETSPILNSAQHHDQVRVSGGIVPLILNLGTIQNVGG